MRGNIWIGDGVDLDDLDQVEGPAFIGNNCRLAREASVGPHSVLGANSTLRERARIERSIIDAGTHIGRSAIVEGAIVGRSCDLRTHARLHEGVAIGDEVSIGAESVIFPGVRIYPYKEVESGAQIHSSLIWESRAGSRVFGRDGVQGLINVDLTPEMALRLGIALGTSLKRGARISASREAPAACRMLKRALITGVLSTGVDVADLRVLPSAVNRHLLKSENFDAGVHIGVNATDPEVVAIQFYERPGIQLTAALQKEIEKHFTRHEARRVGAADVGTISYPARAADGYAADLLSGLDVELIRARALQDRRRLRLLRCIARAPARAGAARRRGRRGAHLHGRAAHADACRRCTRRSARRRTSCAPSARRWASSSTAPPSASTSSTSRRRRFPSTRRCCSTCA